MSSVMDTYKVDVLVHVDYIVNLSILVATLFSVFASISN